MFLQNGHVKNWDFWALTSTPGPKDTDTTSYIYLRRSIAVEQLTTLDAGFLHAEDSDRHVSLAIGGLAIMQGLAPAHESLMSTFAERIVGTQPAPRGRTDR